MVRNLPLWGTLTWIPIASLTWSSTTSRTTTPTPVSDYARTGRISVICHLWGRTAIVIPLTCPAVRPLVRAGYLKLLRNFKPEHITHLLGMKYMFYQDKVTSLASPIMMMVMMLMMMMIRMMTSWYAQPSLNMTRSEILVVHTKSVCT
jgi:hypothetical protein